MCYETMILLQHSPTFPPRFIVTRGRGVTETSVVSTTVSQSQSQTTAIKSQTTDPPKTSSASPTLKRRRVFIPDDDSPPPSPPSPAQKQKTSADISAVVMTTVDETPVVSTIVGQKSTTDLITPTPKPTKLLKRKRETAQATDEKYDPVAAKYPLELETVKNEMKQFYNIDDLTKRKFPSLIGFIIPENMNEYLETKTRQARIRAKVECKDQGDEAILERREFLLKKVKQIAEYANELNKEVLSLFPEAEQRNELRKEYLAYIMKEKFYSAEETKFKDWPLIALKLEADIIEKIKLDPRKKKTAPNWNKYNKFIADLISEHKRKK
ncbi:hypothetical protein HanPI659440_Chr02g0048541 [Helianthus annuus]|nr:hypothetical protein HanPI659440_Chr02g0048541 [Helianthus annuus]